MITKAKYRELTDLPYEDVEVPEWEDTVRIAMLPAGDWVRFANRLDSASTDLRRDVSIMFDVLAGCLRGEDGELLCDSPDDLKGRNMFVLQRLFEKALEVNGMTAGAIDAAEKNSGAVPSTA